MAERLPYSAVPLKASQLVPNDIALSWATQFNTALHSPASVEQALPELLVTDVACWWRDHLALTWDIRTFNTLRTIGDLLKYALNQGRLGPLSLRSASLLPSASDNLSYVQASFGFETDQTRNTAVVKLVRDGEADWKAWTVFTKLEDLKAQPEVRSRLLSPDPPSDAVDAVILGAGQSGLQAAATLRTLGLSCLLVEQHDRIGDQWRQHYDSLKLHLSKWYAQFAYHHWPADTPFFPTRDDVADFLEEYADVTHLNVMTSTTIESARYDPMGWWDFTLQGSDGSSRSIRADHLVLATGINGLRPVMPNIPDRDIFHGPSMHSSKFKNGDAWPERRAIVVGCGNSGHDIAHDLYNHGASVTMIQRNPTMVTHQVLTIPILQRLYNETMPVEVAVNLLESTPAPVAKLLAAIPPRHLNQDVVALHEGLVKAGFKLKPPDRTTFIFERFGGHYLNSGTSNLIADRKISIKSGIPIDRFTADGLAFADGTVLPADLVVFATGYDLRSMRETALNLIGPEQGKNLKEVWGLDDEGNVHGAYRDSGHPRLWYFGGDFQGARYYAKILALQILAVMLGMLERYQGGNSREAGREAGVG